MSYNIDSILTIYENAFGFGPTFDDLAGKYQSVAPKISVFDDDWNVTQPFAWCGEGSESSFDVLLEVLASFEGDVDLVLVWEGGDLIDGLRLRNHKVTRHRVLCSLWEGGDLIDGLRLRNHKVTRHRVLCSLGEEIS